MQESSPKELYLKELRYLRRGEADHQSPPQDGQGRFFQPVTAGL